MRTGQKLRRALSAVVDTQACSARQKAVVKVLVVDGYRLHQRRRHHHCKKAEGRHDTERDRSDDGRLSEQVEQVDNDFQRQISRTKCIKMALSMSL